MRTAAWKLCEFVMFLGLLPAIARAGSTDVLRWRDQPRAQAEGTVLLLPDPPEQLLTIAVALHASGHPGVLLVASRDEPRYVRDYLQRFRPSRIVPLGFTSAEQQDLETNLQSPVEAPVSWDEQGRGPAWDALLATAESVVFCPPEPPGQLLQAACLAGTLRAPLLIHSAADRRLEGLNRRLEQWRTRTAYAVGDFPAAALPEQMTVVSLRNEAAVAQECLRQRGSSPVQTLVVANPADGTGERGGMSRLAPWIALQKSATLLLTNAAGDDVESKVVAALANPRLRQAENVILVGTPEALPPTRRQNPLAGKDAFIETEPLTPTAGAPCSFAVGRLFHSDPAVVPLMLARGKLLSRKRPEAPRVMVVSNPGGGLPLLETFSRHTAQEFRNAGFEVAALFGHNASREELRRRLPDQDVFLWEGHHSTLIKDYEVHAWPEPLAPSLVILQSCLALAEPKAAPFLQRGAVAVLSTSSRTYSGSGGALSLAYCDALLYERQTLGGALRSAKNFLLAFAQLKQKRRGTESELDGANLRAAWAFTLWGDPTLTLPLPAPGPDALPPIRHSVKGDRIVVHLPAEPHPPIITARYVAQTWPNARLAGLLSGTEGDTLVPLVFCEVALPAAPADKSPQLHSKLPEANWVFCWDSRRRTGYLLVRPRARDQGEIRFQVAWQ
jgi:hypothetical protein